MFYPEPYCMFNAIHIFVKTQVMPLQTSDYKCVATPVRLTPDRKMKQEMVRVVRD